MRCYKLGVIILLLFLRCGSEPMLIPFSTVKIGILSKHRLHDATIEVNGGKLVLPGITISLNLTSVRISHRGKALLIKSSGAEHVCGRLMVSSPEIMAVSFSDGAMSRKRFYLGSLDVYIEDNSLAFILTTPLEAYVRAAARSEMGPLLDEGRQMSGKNWRGELTRAMEAAVRSFAASQTSRHIGKEYQFCDLTHCVYFEGMDPDDSTAWRPGEVLVDRKGRIFVTFFHASCGGMLSGPEVYWNESESDCCYRRGEDRLFLEKLPLCSSSPHFHWHEEIPISVMEEILGTTFTDIIPRYREGRIFELSVRNGNRPEIVVPIAHFLSRTGLRLGWDTIRSNLFIITTTKKYCVFEGRGLGHGVGLCQWGAKELALRGKSFSQILEFYYDGADVRRATYRK